MKKVCAPKIDKLIGYNHQSIVVDEETEQLLDKLFDYLNNNLKYDEKDGEEDYYFAFYYEAKRGNIKDFASYEKCVDYYDVTTLEEYHNLWQQEYPNENYWYYFEFRKVVYNNEKYYIISINNHIILNVDPIYAKGWKYNLTNLVNTVQEIAKDLIEFAKLEDYNGYVKKNLDYELREGILLLKDFWKINPKAKKEYFAKLSPIKVDDFIEKVKAQSVDNLILIHDMTANKYYDVCKLAYKAIGKEDNHLTAKELFYKNADGRDQGLKIIDGDSTEAFDVWFTQNKHHFDHTFEILPGRSFYRGDLWVDKKGDGYYLKLSGSNFWTSVDVIKIYMELIKNNIPVILYDEELIIKRLLGESYLAIISRDKMTYGYQEVLGKILLDSMHLPKENRESYLDKIIWEEISTLELQEHTITNIANKM